MDTSVMWGNYRILNVVGQRRASGHSNSPRASNGTRQDHAPVPPYPSPTSGHIRQQVENLRWLNPQPPCSEKQARPIRPAKSLKRKENLSTPPLSGRGVVGSRIF